MKKIFSCFLFLSVLFVVSCNTDDYNVDTKKPSVVEAEPLFTNAVKGIADWQNSVNVNTNVFRFYAQHITATQYLDEPRYDMTTRTIPQALWNGMYVSCLADLKAAQTIVEANTALLSEAAKNNELAQIELMRAYAYSMLVNTFGDIPYSTALDPNNLQPTFDDAKTVVVDLLSRVASATSKLDDSADGFGTGDIMYGGNITKWKKFGNSLRLKLAMMAADADAALAKSNIEAAAQSGLLITANADNALFKYLSSKPNNNPLSNDVPPLSSRKDFVAANTLVDMMNSLSDGRLPAYFTATADGTFKGGIYGFANKYTDFSTFSTKVTAQSFQGNFLDAAEVNFLLAEAVERAFISGDAKSYYDAAITASFEYWGVGAGSSAYLAQPGVDYSNSQSGANWKAKIGNQKWIAMYNRPYDAWTSWRHLDYPTLSPPDAPTVGAIPVRLIYPIVENSLNSANISTAASHIGGDLATTKLWWDKN